MRKPRIAINGLGRIGRAYFKIAHEANDVDVVAINDLADPANLAYLLTYDTAYGTSGLGAASDGKTITVDGRAVTFLSERDPQKLPWKDLDIDVVVEATGVFASYEKSQAHIDAGAKRVVITAPVKADGNGATVLVGVNEQDAATCAITSNASCTTNAASPLIAILKESIGIEKALLNTVHAYTATQAIVDGPARDVRKGRAGAQNIIPTSTGAAIATTKAHTDLAEKFDGIALRVPVVVGSIVDITFLASTETTVDAVNDALTRAAGSDAWRDMFAVTKEPIVSSDIIGTRYAAIADLSFTRVVGGNLVKVLAWYDNETGYAAMLHRHVLKVTSQS